MKEGTLCLSKAGGKTAVAGALVIGDGIGDDLVKLGGSDEIADTSAVFVNKSGQLDLANNSDKVGPLTMTGGALATVKTGTGTLTLNANVTTKASPLFANIVGNLDLGGAARIFVVADGLTGTDLVIPAVISNGAVVKAGLGTLVLDNANTYAGATIVSSGVLRMGNAGALGSTTTGTIVAEGATLALGGFNVTGESLQLSGKGVAGRGALDDFGFTNWNGPVVLNATSSNPNVFVTATSGTLNFHGVVSGSAGLKAQGTGIVELSGTAANTYAGATHAAFAVGSGGLLVIDKSAGVAVPHGLIVDAGSTVFCASNDEIAATSNVSVNGTLLLNGYSNTISSLTMKGGNVQTGGGVLTVPAT